VFGEDAMTGRCFAHSSAPELIQQKRNARLNIRAIAK